jgi:hypothetical protein
LLPDKNIDTKIYKRIGKNTPSNSSVSESSNSKILYHKKKNLRKTYESMREKLLSLAKNNPQSKEYKDLKTQCQEIFQAAENITINRSQ